jgi:hypothetical protein
LTTALSCDFLHHCRTARVDRASADRESSAGGVTGSGVSGGESEEFGRRSRYPDNLQVFVGNLPHNFSEAELKEYFESKLFNVLELIVTV